MFEPVFLWVEKYGALDNVGINLSPEHTFDVKTEENKITLEYRSNKKYYTDIYGKNLDIVAIVGENGTGKTTLTDAIGDCFYSNPMRFPDNNVLRVVSNNGKLEVHFFKKMSDFTELVFPLDESDAEKFEIIDGKLHKEYKEIDYIDKDLPTFGSKISAGIYYSNIFDVKYLYASKGLKDISTNGVLRHIRDKAPVNIGYDLGTQFFWREFKLQLGLATVLSGDNNNDFLCPTDVYVEFPDLNSEKENLTAKLKLFSRGPLKYSQIINSFMQPMTYETYIKKYRDDSDKTFTFLRVFSAAIRFAILRNIQFIDHYEDFTLDIETIKNERTDDQNDWEYTKAILDELKNNTRRKIYEKYFEFMSWVETKQDKLIALLSNSPTDVSETAFKRKSLLFKNIFNSDNSLFKEFYKAYNKTVDEYSDAYLCFTWAYPTSTGEHTLFTLFSRLYALTDKGVLKPEHFDNVENKAKAGKPSHVTIIIDEIDLSLHPKWQQRIISDLVKYVPKFFDCNQNKIRIIITTHSPIILSDIPKQNTILLQQNNGKISVVSPESRTETFAANIATLYYETFLLDKGSFGEFSSKYIKNIIDKISFDDHSEKNKDLYEDLEKQISIIGEPIIRHKLFDMLDEWYYSGPDGKRSISDHEVLLKQKAERAQKEYEEFRNGAKQ